MTAKSARRPSAPAEPRAKALRRQGDLMPMAPNRRVAKPQLPPEVEGTREAADVAASLPPLAMDAEGEGTESAPTLPKVPSAVGRAVRVLAQAVGVLALLVASGIAAWAARRYVTTSPRFALTEVEVKGTTHRSKDDILRQAGLAPAPPVATFGFPEDGPVPGQNVFSLDLDEVRTRLLADPWIKEATLARRLPGTVLVQVVERDAAAVVALPEAYLVARDGEVWKRLEPTDPSDLPVITGITPQQLEDDRTGTTRTLRRALDLASEYDHGPLAGRSALQELHVDEAGGVTVTVGKSGLALALGDPPYRRKLEQAARVLAELDRQGAKADAIMLDDEARPERVVVRVR